MKIKSKKNMMFIIILIFLIILVIILDIYLFKIRKTYKNVENTNEILTKAIWCQKENIRFKNEEIGIEYTLKNEYYSFYINKNQELISDVWQMTLLFDTLDDFNIYYNYLVNVIKFKESVIDKNEQQMTITQTLNALQGNDKYFNDEYLNRLIKNGYVCHEI